MKMLQKYNKKGSSQYLKIDLENKYPNRSGIKSLRHQLETNLDKAFPRIFGLVSVWFILTDVCNNKHFRNQ